MGKRKIWRLILSGKLTAQENMAVDEALLKHFKPETSMPVFRLYEWEPAAISLGRFQDANTVIDLSQCQKNQTTVVRRMTGGGAIFHTSELTYSLICSEKDLPGTLTIKESYRTLTRFLIMTYADLSLKADYACNLLLKKQKYKIGEKTPVCFAGWEPYDIIIRGKKIGGNAQFRKKNIVLQHGSIPLKFDFDQSKKLFTKQPSNITSTTTALVNEGITVSSEALEKLCIKNFSKHLQIEFLKTDTTIQENFTVKHLIDHKYMCDNWNLKRISEPIF
jgi:lipoyl(octanoyl) transferase